MLPSQRRALPLYAIGLGCVFGGAWMTQLSGSLLPLALGASASLMCTYRVVRDLVSQRSRSKR